MSSGHLSVGEELVTGQGRGPHCSKTKEEEDHHQSPIGRGQRTSVFITPLPEGLDCC